MDWWHKIRTWTALPTRFKIRKSAGGVGGDRRGGRGEYGGDCDGAGGLLKLRDDVQMCGYRDVEVMWNMLSINLQPEPMEAARSTKAKHLKRDCNSKQRSIWWSLFFWTNHNP